MAARGNIDERRKDYENLKECLPLPCLSAHHFQAESRHHAAQSTASDLDEVAAVGRPQVRLTSRFRGMMSSVQSGDAPRVGWRPYYAGLTFYVAGESEEDHGQNEDTLGVRMQTGYLRW